AEGIASLLSGTERRAHSEHGWTVSVDRYGDPVASKASSSVLQVGRVLTHPSDHDLVLDG
ncbi:MAG: hypothetical protein WBV77_14575, partial [Solirubrobacteraceae bacterium]